MAFYTSGLKTDIDIIISSGIVRIIYDAVEIRGSEFHKKAFHRTAKDLRRVAYHTITSGLLIVVTLSLIG
jgi:hypothetical protein